MGRGREGKDTEEEKIGKAPRKGTSVCVSGNTNIFRALYSFLYLHIDR